MHSLFQINKTISSLTLLCIEKLVFLKKHIDGIGLSIERNDKVSFKKDTYKNCLKQILSLFSTVFSSNKDVMEENDSTIINGLNCLLDTINKFQDELSMLPKYEAPIEIYRFLRIFDKDGIASLDNQKINFVLYPGDNNKELKIYENTPLELFETTTLRDCYRVIARSEGPGATKSDKAYHISIPREEIELPLYWPLLAHEVGHQVMAQKLFHERKIIAAFANYLGGDIANKYSPAFMRLLERIPGDTVRETGKDSILAAWLTECWCDIYGYFAVGPAFIFAQRSSFVSKGARGGDFGNKSHPPCYLRLLVLNTIAHNHQVGFFESADNAYSPLDSEFAEMLINCESDLQDDIHDTAQWFADFFNDHFKMETAETENLHAHIKKLKSLLDDFDLEPLSTLIQRVDNGYPIPSLRVNDDLHERETSVYEIMAAAWLSHDTTLASEAIKVFCDRFEALRTADAEGKWKIFAYDIAPLFEKFDQSILRSLQVSEWVEMFRAKEYPRHGSSEERSEPGEYAPPLSPSILVDNQIKELLSKDDLKILPLINIDAQLGSTSLDVRLGTTFQTYQPNQSGIIDFRDDSANDNAQQYSTVKDLDFKKSIVLAPGQFVLAHTLEYVGLPDGIAAQLEGRSSFARLGIQIHMTASFIDPGFHGSITFEIYNAGPNPIRLFPGYRIGQLRFFPCEKPTKPYNKKKNAKYKGLLGHSSSLLKNDYEIDLLKD